MLLSEALVSAIAVNKAIKNDSIGKNIYIFHGIDNILWMYHEGRITPFINSIKWLTHDGYHIDEDHPYHGPLTKSDVDKMYNLLKNKQ